MYLTAAMHLMNVAGLNYVVAPNKYIVSNGTHPNTLEISHCDIESIEDEQEFVTDSLDPFIQATKSRGTT